MKAIEKLILLHLNLSSEPVILDRLKNRLGLNDFQVLKSLKNINKYLSNNLGLETQCVMENNTLFLTDNEFDFFKHVDKNNIEFLTDEEFNIILLDTFITNGGNSNSNIQNFFKKENLKITSDQFDNVLTKELLLEKQKRLQLTFLLEFFKKFPIGSFSDFGDYIPDYLFLILKNWLGDNWIIDTYNKIDFVLNNQNRSQNFWNTLHLTLIFILWRDYKSNINLFNLNKTNFHLAIDSYELKKEEKDIVDSYCKIPNLDVDTKNNKDFLNLIDIVVKLYEPINENRLISLKEFIKETLEQQNNPNFVPKISIYNNPNFWMPETHFIIDKVKKCIPDYQESIQYQIAFDIFYWLLEQIVLDPINIVFIIGGKTAKIDYFLQLISNTFCCSNIKICNIFEFKEHLYKDKTVILTEFPSILKKGNNIIQLNNIHLGEQQDLIRQICFLVLKKEIKSKINHLDL